MPLSAGDKLGPYEILGPIGAGGMGEVYRARDSKLNREVAIKVLPTALANDADYLARFQREAQVLAALNHPNIATIYGLEEHAIVMELVEGETLAERIAHGPLSVEEALPIARQIAEALEAAHEKGIVHRDLKPGNVKITPEGIVKVLDFGLAKTADGRGTPDASISPTQTIRATEIGMIMGTAGYMSPEQSAGKPIDKRADIWSFGVVLWEMLMGRRLFEGETVSHTLAHVLTAPIDFNSLPARPPPALSDLLRRCLDRDIKTRLRDIGEARIALQKYMASPVLAEPVVFATAPRRRYWLPWAVASLVAAALAALAFVHFRERPPEAALVRFTIPPPENTGYVLTGPNANNGPPALSPDGRRLAFNARSADGKVQTWIRSLDSLTAQPLPGTEGATHPFWSPDGRFLAFFADAKLKKIDVSGGSPLALCDAPDAVGGTWSREGVIVFAPGGSLQKVSAAGGALSAVTALDQTRHEISHRWPWFLPDGRHFLYLAVGREHSSIQVGSLDSRESRPVLENQLSAVYAQGYLLYVRDTILMAQPFDAKRLVITGEAVPLADQIQILPVSLRGVFSASESGILVYQTGARSANQLTWFERSGKRTGTLGDPGTIFSVEFSPDRRYVAVSRNDTEAGRDIWIFDVARGLKTRFTFDPAEERQTAWSPDGQRIVFNSNRNGHFDLFQKQANGVGGEQLLLAGSLDKYPSSWSPDGKFLLYDSRGDPKTKADVWVLPMTAERSGGQTKPFPFAQTSFAESNPQFSPDGRWIAYQSNESEHFEIYVAPFPGPGGKRQISTAGGTQPRWRKDGKEIYYLAPGGQLMAAGLSVKGDVLDVGAVSPLFSLGITGGGYLYDVSADGQHFLARTEPGAATVQPITVVQNWTAALRNK